LFLLHITWCISDYLAVIVILNIDFRISIVKISKYFFNRKTWKSLFPS
jgi:hypothetical protein